MPTVITAVDAAGEIRRCNATCHDAGGDRCNCICGGRNHGVGYRTAQANNSREFAAHVYHHLVAAGHRPLTIQRRTPQLHLFATEPQIETETINHKEIQIMPNWTNKPPETDNRFAHRIVRTPADKPLIGIVTSEHPIGCYTHYANGRTVPCEGEQDCEACKTGFAYRWHGYAAVLLTDKLEHVIFEYTAPPAKTFAAYAEQYETLRGCYFHASRPGKRPNSRVVLKAVPGDLQKWRLPDPPDLKTILCHIWGVQNTSELPVYCAKPEHPTVHVASSKNDARYPSVKSPRGNSKGA